MIDAMSDEEAEEFEQRRPWLAKAAALIGSGMATIVGMVQMGLIGFILLLLGLLSQGAGGLAGFALFAGVLAISNEIVDVEDDAAHPYVLRVLGIGFIAWFYFLGVALKLLESGAPYAESLIYGIIVTVGLMAVVDSILRPDTWFHDRLFGEVSST